MARAQTRCVFIEGARPARLREGAGGGDWTSAKTQPFLRPHFSTSCQLLVIVDLNLPHFSSRMRENSPSSFVPSRFPRDRDGARTTDGEESGARVGGRERARARARARA